ncbi:hypothetical protein [Aliikangiella maris]|uniref:Uncharacterized protein n=2 Tax=Aliikangiella maris TaxID=3162458 RepID=A0ABV2BX81_9GAMM
MKPLFLLITLIVFLFMTGCSARLEMYAANRSDMKLLWNQYSYLDSSQQATAQKATSQTQPIEKPQQNKKTSTCMTLKTIQANANGLNQVELILKKPGIHGKLTPDNELLPGSFEECSIS